MAVYTEDAAANQAAHPTDNSGGIPPKRKVGVEIVCSAELSSRFFRGWRAASYSLRDGDDLWAKRLAAAMR